MTSTHLHSQGPISQPSGPPVFPRPVGAKDPSSTLLPCTPLTWTSIRRQTFDASIWMARVMCWMLLARWGKQRPLFSHPPRPWWTRNRWRKRQGKANSWQKQTKIVKFFFWVIYPWLESIKPVTICTIVTHQTPRYFFGLLLLLRVTPFKCASSESLIYLLSIWLLRYLPVTAMLTLI